MPSTPPATSITGFRQRIRSILDHQAGASSRRHVIILAIDGIPYDLAVRCWRHAKIERMTSVFPTTSSTAWLSSLSGMTVDTHGVPGVVFKIPDCGGQLINVFDSMQPIFEGAIENIFSDATALGYVPLSILGDLEDFDCSWRRLLLQHSRAKSGHRFYTGWGGHLAPNPAILCGHVKHAILQWLDAQSQRGPCLVWCFIDADVYIHRHGYDRHIVQFLEAVDQVATDLAQRDAIVVAHSDHALTPTKHDSDIERLLETITRHHQCALGGAGRTRWLYPVPGAGQELKDALMRALPLSIRVAEAGEFFVESSLSRRRVGDILLIAQGENFLTSINYCFDHGSFTEQEIGVPFSEWQA
jgi:Type I phosphodiesterase / nucleotide pyrophosphatase